MCRRIIRAPTPPILQKGRPKCFWRQIKSRFPENFFQGGGVPQGGNFHIQHPFLERPSRENYVSGRKYTSLSGKRILPKTSFAVLREESFFYHTEGTPTVLWVAPHKREGRPFFKKPPPAFALHHQRASNLIKAPSSFAGGESSFLSKKTSKPHASPSHARRS